MGFWLKLENAVPYFEDKVEVQKCEHVEANGSAVRLSRLITTEKPSFVELVVNIEVPLINDLCPYQTVLRYS